MRYEEDSPPYHYCQFLVGGSNYKNPSLHSPFTTGESNFGSSELRHGRSPKSGVDKIGTLGIHDPCVTKEKKKQGQRGENNTDKKTVIIKNGEI